MTGKLPSIADYLTRAAREATERANRTKPAALPARRGLKPRWHVIRTNIKCENRAKLGIEALGFAVYLPMESRTVIRRRRKVDVSSPVFGRYMFVEFDADADEWSALRRIDGVEGIVTNNLRPVPVPALVMERVRLAEEIGAFDTRRNQKPGAIGEGMAVKVGDGAFVDFVATVKKLRTGDRVDILLNLLGASRLVTVPLSSLREAG